MNGSESKLNRVSPTSSASKTKHDRTPPPAYQSKEQTMVLSPTPQIPVGNWTMETWQPPLPSEKCPLPPIKRNMPVCSETRGRLSVGDALQAHNNYGQKWYFYGKEIGVVKFEVHGDFIIYLTHGAVAMLWMQMLKLETVQMLAETRGVNNLDFQFCWAFLHMPAHDCLILTITF